MNEQENKIILDKLESIKLEIENGTLQGISIIAMSENLSDPRDTNVENYVNARFGKRLALQGLLTHQQYTLNKMIERHGP